MTKLFFFLFALYTMFQHNLHTLGFFNGCFKCDAKASFYVDLHQDKYHLFPFITKMSSWFGFGSKRNNTATSSEAVSVTTARNEEDEKRQLFTAYVEDIAHAQRVEIADRIDKIISVDRNSTRYFLATQLFTVSFIYGYGMLYANRNFLRTTADKLRPLPMSLAMGCIVYHMTYSLRQMAMRARLATLMSDYEFHIKNYKCHHVEAGMTQLAWLQFVADHIKNFKESDLDTNKMRELKL